MSTRVLVRLTMFRHSDWSQGRNSRVVLALFHHGGGQRGSQYHQPDREDRQGQAAGRNTQRCHREAGKEVSGAKGCLSCCVMPAPEDSSTLFTRVLPHFTPLAVGFRRVGVGAWRVDAGAWLWGLGRRGKGGACVVWCECRLMHAFFPLHSCTIIVFMLACLFVFLYVCVLLLRS